MNAYNQYQENQVMSASPEQILLMLYDGAVRFCRQAISGIEEKDLAKFHRGIRNSMAIIAEFSNSLDHSIGGRIADDLEALYDFMIRELLLANLHKDIEKIEVVEGLLKDLRGTWNEAIEINNREQTSLQKIAAKSVEPSLNSTQHGYIPLSISR